ncbi:MAG TPA: DUF4126 domain-containing protein [Pyrinomonadaceae bacterium]|nr:DUF4126 domain-containing protein [Pyrinomonadaceae bacterium]
MEKLDAFGSLIGLGLTSGVNLYATVLVVGLGIRLGLITINPELSGLEVLGNPFVIGVAGLIYMVEFLADKFPWIDSAWDAVHTVIRPLGAAALGVASLGRVEPVTSVVAGLFCGGIALTGHSTKAGTRLIINHSPEPFSNILVSTVEDLLVVFAAWLAFSHPLIMLGIGLTFIALFIWFAPKVFRLIRIQWVAFWSFVNKLFAVLTGHSVAQPAAVGPNVNLPVGMVVGGHRPRGSAPNRYVNYIEDRIGGRGDLCCAKCFAGKGVKGLRNSVGYVYLTDGSLWFVTRRLFRFRSHEINKGSIEGLTFKRRILFDQLTVKAGGKRQNILFFKDIYEEGERVFQALNNASRN